MGIGIGRLTMVLESTILGVLYQYYRTNIMYYYRVSDTSESDTIYMIYIGISQCLKQMVFVF